MTKLMAGLALALLASAAACGGSQKHATAAGPTCDEVAASARAAWLAGPGSEAPEAAQLAPAIAEVVAQRCVADAWAPATMTCLAKATGEAFEACGKQLTDDQRASLTSAMAAKVAPQMDQMMKGSSDGMEGGTGAAPPRTKAADDPCGADE